MAKDQFNHKNRSLMMGYFRSLYSALWVKIENLKIRNTVR